MAMFLDAVTLAAVSYIWWQVGYRGGERTEKERVIWILHLARGAANSPVLTIVQQRIHGHIDDAEMKAELTDYVTKRERQEKPTGGFGQRA